MKWSLYSLALALDAVHPLTPAVGVRDLDLLELVLDVAELRLDTHSLKPFVVLFDDVLDL